MDLKIQLLQWIREEEQKRKNLGKVPLVSAHFLLVQTALLRQQQGVEATTSIELSMQVYERASVGRALRELIHEKVIHVVDENGKALPIDEKELVSFSEGERSNIKFVASAAGF